MSFKFYYVFFVIIHLFVCSCVKKDCPLPVIQESKIDVKISDSQSDLNEILINSSSDIRDAFLANYYPNVNYGLDYKNYCTAWTVGGVSTKGLFLIKFNYNSIPKGVDIISAKLTLIADTSNIFIGSPPPMKAHYGTNLNWSIRRVERSWDELIVTYSTKPSISEVNKVNLNSPSSLTSSYYDIDVLKLVRDQILTSNHGFEISLDSDTPYARLAFYSSNSPYVLLRPKLSITYK